MQNESIVVLPYPGGNQGAPCRLPSIASQRSLPFCQATCRCKLAMLVMLMTMLRCLAAGSLPLLGSEAYYWLWGQHPAAGYDFHPPMVGLLSRAFFGWVLGSHLAARSAPIVLGALSTLLVFALSRELFQSEKTAWRTAALFSIIPIFDAFSVLVEPDNSLMLFALLTWLFFWKAVRRPSSLVLWIAMGIMAGLTLLSKFHAWILLPPLYGFLLFSRDNRPLLKRAGPWLAVLVALAVLSPNLVWNSHHEWPNYVHAWRRSGMPRSGFRLLSLFNYFAGSAAILSPLVYVAILVAAWRGLARYRFQNDHAALFLLCAGLPMPLTLGILSILTSSVSPHWLGVGFIPLLVLMVGLMERGMLFSPRFQRWMWGLCLFMTAMLHVGPFIVQLLPADFELSYFHKKLKSGVLTSNVAIWNAVGRRVAEIRDRMNAQAPTVIMAPGWHLAAHLSFYTQRPKECFSLTEEDARNYVTWYAERGGLIGRNAVVIVSNPASDPASDRAKKHYAKLCSQLSALFGRVEPGFFLSAGRDGRLREDHDLSGSKAMPWGFQVFRCYGFKGLPPEGMNGSKLAAAGHSAACRRVEIVPQHPGQEPFLVFSSDPARGRTSQ